MMMKKMLNGFFILSGPFMFDANHEPELLQVVPDDTSIIKHNGIHFINSRLFSPDDKTGAELNSDFKNLVESVMNKSATSSKPGD